MDLEQQAMIITNIHDKMQELIDQRLHVRANLGRSKILENDGKLLQVHPQLFIMEVDCKRGRKARQSYQFVDILTGTVEIFKDGEPVFGPFIVDTPSENVADMLADALADDSADDSDSEKDNPAHTSDDSEMLL